MHSFCFMLFPAKAPYGLRKQSCAGFTIGRRLLVDPSEGRERLLGRSCILISNVHGYIYSVGSDSVEHV
jgi:hypothetical protein